MSEILNAIQLSSDDLTEIRGLADLAFIGIDYEPIKPTEFENNVDFTVQAGSMREKSTFDAQSGQMVGVGDFIGLVSEVGTPFATRRLMAVWEDGSEEEVDLDEGCVILDDHRDASEKELNKSKVKIIQALTACLEDAI